MNQERNQRQDRCERTWFQLMKNDRSEVVFRPLILEKEERSWSKEARGREELTLFPREPKRRSILMGPQALIYRV